MRALRALVCACVLLGPATAIAADRYVVIVSGASGAEKYAVLQHTWSETLIATLKTRFAVAGANIAMLGEEEQGSARATAANVTRVLGDLRRRMTADDVLMLVLFGHGTIDGNDAKFNLVGPDLTAADWKAALDPLPGRIVVVNTTESSFPFIDQLSRKGRVVITATDSVAQRYATIFPEYFVQALGGPVSDLDKDGRISILEAFVAASAAVRQHYEQRGQLSTERPLLDDDGDRVGKEAQAPGNDGGLARSIYLDPDRAPMTEDAALVELERERNRLQQEIEDLKSRRQSMSDSLYQAEMEKLLVRLARVSALIRGRS